MYLSVGLIIGVIWITMKVTTSVLLVVANTLKESK